MKIPVILQKVSAGFPSPATDYVQDEIDLNSELIKNPPATFLIRVQGNSMTEHKITTPITILATRSMLPMFIFILSLLLI
jgi:DNA polymerase V